MSPTKTTVPIDPVKPLTLAPGEIQFFQKYGFLVIPGLLTENAVTPLHDEVMEVMQLIGLAMDKLKQTTEYLAGRRVDALVNSPRLRQVATQLLGGPSSLYLPFTAVKGTGGGRFHFHQDNQYTRLDGPALNLWTALTPMSPENGCLQIVPGSHLNGTLDSIESGDGDEHRKVPMEPDDFLPVRLRPGDCVAFTRLTVHGSGPNLLPIPRVAYAVQFHRDDVNWLDRKTGQWKSLKQFPPRSLTPVQSLRTPTSKTDGH